MKNNKKQFKESTQKIVKLLKKGKSQRSIIRSGYPESTVRYHHKRLYRPDAYHKLVERSKVYQKQRKEEAV